MFKKNFFGKRVQKTRENAFFVSCAGQLTKSPTLQQRPISASVIEFCQNFFAKYVKNIGIILVPYMWGVEKI